MANDDCKEPVVSLLTEGLSDGALPPESDSEGNVEYKLKLMNPSGERLEQLITQMKWRLSEGNGEALYEIGVDDDGTIKGLTSTEMQTSIHTLQKMAAELKADVSVVQEIILDAAFFQAHNNSQRRDLLEQQLQEHKQEEYRVAEVLVKRKPDRQSLTDLRIVLVGGLGAGKSTLLSYITHGTKDNGRGSARLNLLRHRHELESGRSSSISHEIIGYDAQGQLINYATTHIHTWEQICDSSHKVITLLDTCGYPKYLRTTISALMGYAPDYACLVIAANSASTTNTNTTTATTDASTANKATPTIDDMTREHLSIAVMLDVPVFIVMTKSDVATHDQLKSTLHLLLGLLKSSPWLSKKVPVVVQNENDAMTYASRFMKRESGSELPIFLVSNVTGVNMNLLQMFLNYLPKPKRLNYDELLEEPVEFQIEEVYTIPDVGIVVGGVLGQGRMNVKEKNKKYYLGPNSKGEFIQVGIVSMHRHRMPVHYVHCGQTATLALKDDQTLASWKITRGMVLLEVEEDDKQPDCYRTFEVELTVVYHATGVSPGTCGMIHSGSIRERAKVLSVERTAGSSDNLDNVTEGLSTIQISKEPPCEQNKATTLHTGERGRCFFRFMYEPCYLKLGSQILFMEGRSKCIGQVIKLIPN